MFNLRDFLKNGFIKAIGSMPTYKIILNAAGWYDKEVLTEDDLKEINEAIEAYENAETLVNDSEDLEPESVEAETSEETTEPEITEELTD